MLEQPNERDQLDTNIKIAALIDNLALQGVFRMWQPELEGYGLQLNIFKSTNPLFNWLNLEPDTENEIDTA